jgi:hypothetical protein
MPESLFDARPGNVSRAACGPGAALILERRADGQLHARRGDTHAVVHVRRCFPWSDPAKFISLRDAEDEEFAFVADPCELHGDARAALEAAIAEAGFVFDVTAVLDIEEEVELRHWSVQTLQGDRRLQTRLDEWPRVLPGGGLLVRDVTGDFYRVADPSRLDRKSQSLLWAFVD